MITNQRCNQSNQTSRLFDYRLRALKYSHAVQTLFTKFNRAVKGAQLIFGKFPQVNYSTGVPFKYDDSEVAVIGRIEYTSDIFIVHILWASIFNKKT